MSNQLPADPPPHPLQPYYIPVKTGPSAGKVILWVIGLMVAIPILLVIQWIVILLLT